MISSAQELARAEVAARHGDPGTGEPQIGAVALDGLTGALEDPEPAVVAAAVEALGACRRAELAPRIARLLAAGGGPPIVAVAALRALAILDGPAPELVVRAAAHDDPEVVKEAMAAAARLPGAAGERLLREGMRSARWDVRRAVALALAARADPALLPLAEERAAAEPDPLVARAFAEAAQALRSR